MRISSSSSSSSSNSVSTTGGNEKHRVIAHVDLDCFYVQVERSLNPDLHNKPVAVVQYNPFGDLRDWPATEKRYTQSGGLIAVSYEARAQGVKRSMRGAEAKKACPELMLVQVPTSHGKADLRIYRDASAEIVRVLGTRFKSSSTFVLERASIDEVYMDVSSEAEKLLSRIESGLWAPDAGNHASVAAAPATAAGATAAGATAAGATAAALAITNRTHGDTNNNSAGGDDSSSSSGKTEGRVTLSVQPQGVVDPFSIFLSSALDILLSSQCVAGIAGDDPRELKMGRSEIRNGHAEFDMTVQSTHDRFSSSSSSDHCSGKSSSDGGNINNNENNNSLGIEISSSVVRDNVQPINTSPTATTTAISAAAAATTSAIPIPAISAAAAAKASVHPWFDRPATEWNRRDRLLLCGCVLVQRLRRDVFEQLGFTVSAGVAGNKMLAKICSAMRKPNKLTLVPKEYTQSLMDSIPFSRVQGFGGKLGAQLMNEFGGERGSFVNNGGGSSIISNNSNDCDSASNGSAVKTVGDILKIDKELLTSKFGASTALWMRAAAAGMCSEPVLDRALALSIGCSKTFRGQHALPLLLPMQTTDELEQLCVEIESYERSQKLLHDNKNNITNVNSSSSNSGITSSSGTTTESTSPPPPPPPTTTTTTTHGSSSAALNVRTDGSPMKVGAMTCELDVKYRSNVLYWLRALALELQERIEADVAVNSRIPQQLTVGATLRRVAYNNGGGATIARNSISNIESSSNGGGGGAALPLAAIDVNPLPPPPADVDWIMQSTTAGIIDSNNNNNSNSNSNSGTTLVPPPRIVGEETVLIPDFHVSRSGNFRLHSVSVRIIVKHALILLCKVLTDNPHVGPYCSGLAGEGGTADGWVIGILSLSAGQFRNVVSGAGSIASFFAKGSATTSTKSSSSSSSSSSVFHHATDATKDNTPARRATTSSTAIPKAHDIVTATANTTTTTTSTADLVPAASAATSTTTTTTTTKGLHSYFESKNTLRGNIEIKTKLSVDNCNLPTLSEVCLINIDDDDDDNKDAVEIATDSDCKRRRVELTGTEHVDCVDLIYTNSSSSNSSNSSYNINKSAHCKDETEDEKSDLQRSCYNHYNEQQENTTHDNNISYKERQKRSYRHIQPTSCGEIDPRLLAELPADLLQELLDEHHAADNSNNISSETATKATSYADDTTTSITSTITAARNNAGLGRTAIVVAPSSNSTAAARKQQQQQQNYKHSKKDIRSFLFEEKR